MLLRAGKPLLISKGVQHHYRVPEEATAEETPETSLSSKIKDFTAISNSLRILL